MNDSALQRFVNHHTRAETALERINEYIADHGEVLPEDVGWTDVSEMAHLASLLEEIKRWIDNEEE